MPVANSELYAYAIRCARSGTHTLIHTLVRGFTLAHLHRHTYALAREGDSLYSSVQVKFIEDTEHF